MTFEEMKNLSEEEQLNLYLNLKKTRQQYKTTNYAATYKIGAAKLARELKSTTAIAKGLLNAYWKRNWAIKAFADDCKIIYYGKEMWVQNPLNGFYYNLRAKKDVFSTVNQSTGTYCFDMWLYFILQKCRDLVGQFHDEFILDIKKGNEEKTKRIIKNAMDKVNKKLSLNVELGFDVKFGENYARIH